MFEPQAHQRERAITAPGVILALVGLMGAIHAVRYWLLDNRQDTWLLLYGAFIPARYAMSPLEGGAAPGGFAADVWTFVSYAFLHGDWTHLLVNSFWLLAFGSAVAWRFGPLRFLAFFCLTAAAGALAHLVTHGGAFVPMVGASAAISGCMAAAARFMFELGGPLSGWRFEGEAAHRRPAPPLTQVMRDPRVLSFLAIWFVLNLVFGVGSLPIGEAQSQVAWQAHLGGFIAGLLGFVMFDPLRYSVPMTENWHE